MANKEKILIKEEEREEPSEIHTVPRIHKKSERDLDESFFNKLIGQAKFIQDILTALGVMLEEIQGNLDLLPKESKERILWAAKEVVEKAKQRRIKAEIQEILREGNWLEENSSTTSEGHTTILTEEIVKEDKRGENLNQKV